MGIGLPKLSLPGLFVTGTDTGVGKTVITCAIAAALRGQLAGSGGGKANPVGVLKPLASGCRREREGLVSDDAEALAHFSDCRLPLSVISPVCYGPALAPGQAKEVTGVGVDYGALGRAMEELEAGCETLLVEGVGGVMVPLDERWTVLDLIVEVGYPVVVVTRAGLGTLNHTGLTVRVLRDAGVRVAGLVVNGFDAESEDASVALNRRWLSEMNGVPVLAVVPGCGDGVVRAERGEIPGGVLEAVGRVDWVKLLARAV